MGEIKSTLDLVLEKTKHLSQSSEEKQPQIRKEVEIRIQVRHAFNAFLERCAIPAGKIGAAESLFKD